MEQYVSNANINTYFNIVCCLQLLDGLTHTHTQNRKLNILFKKTKKNFSKITTEFKSTCYIKKKNFYFYCYIYFPCFCV